MSAARGPGRTGAELDVASAAACLRSRADMTDRHARHAPVVGQHDGVARALRFNCRHFATEVEAVVEPGSEGAACSDQRVVICACCRHGAPPGR